MSSTVNPVTIDIVHSMTTSSALELVYIITLLLLLAQKFLVAASNSPFARLLSLALNIPLIPLLLKFILVVIVRILEILD